MNRKLRSNKGFAFIVAVAIMFLLLTIGLSFVSIDRVELQLAENQMDITEAFYNAESAAEMALAELLNNFDADGDGLGTIPSTDIDTDGVGDFYASYDSGTGMITAVGSEGLAQRTVTLEMNAGPWTGAFQVGGRISPAMTLSFSTVTGNVDARLNIANNFTSQQTITGTVTANNNSLTIPTTDLSNTGAYAASADFTHADCSWLTNSPPPGVHYVDGDCSYNGGSTGPFVLNGSLIVNGDLTIQSITNAFTVIPTGDNPALVADGTLELTTLYGVDITGLIYGGASISLNTWDYYSGHRIAGAIVTGGDLGMNTIARTNWIFDSNMAPPYFSGGSGGSYTVNIWRAH